MKHTKGPWRRQGAIIWGAEIQRQVAHVHTQPGESDQDNANARLIKAAPDLLIASKDACLMIKETDELVRYICLKLGANQPIGLSESVRFMAILDCIAKAEGK